MHYAIDETLKGAYNIIPEIGEQRDFHSLCAHVLARAWWRSYVKMFGRLLAIFDGSKDRFKLSRFPVPVTLTLEPPTIEIGESRLNVFSFVTKNRMAKWEICAKLNLLIGLCSMKEMAKLFGKKLFGWNKIFRWYAKTWFCSSIDWYFWKLFSIFIHTLWTVIQMKKNPF